jgi:hypothetical protein
MANALTANPIIIDTAGATSEILTPLRLDFIIVTPSSGGWVVLLHKEAAGTNIVLSVVGSTADSVLFPFPEHFITTLYATTLTSITAVHIFRR